MGNISSRGNDTGNKWMTAIIVFAVVVVIAIVAAFVYYSSCPSSSKSVRFEEVEEPRCNTALAQTTQAESIYNNPVKLSHAEKSQSINKVSKNELIQKYKAALSMRNFSTMVPRVSPGSEMKEAVKRIHLGHSVNSNVALDRFQHANDRIIAKHARKIANSFNNSPDFMTPMNPNVIDAARTA